MSKTKTSILKYFLEKKLLKGLSKSRKEISQGKGRVLKSLKEID